MTGAAAVTVLAGIIVIWQPAHKSLRENDHLEIESRKQQFERSIWTRLKFGRPRGTDFAIG